MRKNDSAKKTKSKLYFLRSQLGMWLLLLPTLLTFILCKWNPVIRGLILSFFKTKGYTAVEFVGLQNYMYVLTDTMFFDTLVNSLEYVFWSILIGSLPPLILAIALNEMTRGKEFFKVATYLPAIAPGLAVTLIWRALYSPNPGGALNMIMSLFGQEPGVWLLNEKLVIPLIVISMTWSGYAGTTLLYLAALQSVRKDLYEAAVVDGAGVFRRLRTITIPTIAPTMLLMIVQQFIGVFQIMDPPLVMTGGGPNNASLSINLSIYKMAFEYMQADRSLALGSVSFVLLLFITMFYFKADKKLNEY